MKLSYTMQRSFVVVPCLVAALAAQQTPPQTTPPAPGGQQPYVPRGDQPAVPPPQTPPQEPARASTDAPPPQMTAQDPPVDAPSGGGSTLRFDVLGGAGRMRHKSQGSPTTDDDTSAGYLRVGLEVTGGGFSGGARLELAVSDDDLFAGSGGAASQATDFDLFVHGTAQLGGDSLQLPLRFGLFLRDYEIEVQSTSDTTDWFSIGPRLELEPDFALLRGDTARWSVYGRAAVAVGVTGVATDPSTEDFVATMTAFDLGVGTRLSFAHAVFELGWLDRNTRYAESDTVNSIFVRRADVEFEGLVFGGSIRF